MPLQINTSRVICINLSSLNTEQIFSISEFYKLSFESLMIMKNTNVYKLWCEPNAQFAIAASYTTSKDRIIWHEVYSSPTSKDYKKVISVGTVKVPRLTKTEQVKKNYTFYKSSGYEINISSLEKTIIESNDSNNKVELTVDNILDKIKDKGIQSLTKKEKKFLDEASKNM